ncbi:MAG: hypothetical protein NT018_09855, partial [Armatimonadetes bacterium]|nr:hypothetical protein [Armatimonadota bacterium]
RFSEELAAQAANPYIGKYKVPLPSNPLIGMGCDTTITAWLTHLRSEANLSLLQTEIALRRYNVDNGRYPNKLEQISPKYLKTVPIDLFGGKPLRYISINAGKTFKLYSIGPDLKDNGGAGVKIREWTTAGDLVLGQGEK